MRILSKTFSFSWGKNVHTFDGKQSGKLIMPLLALLTICFFGLPAQAHC